MNQKPLNQLPSSKNTLLDANEIDDLFRYLGISSNDDNNTMHIVNYYPQYLDKKPIKFISRGMVQ